MKPEILFPPSCAGAWVVAGFHTGDIRTSVGKPTTTSGLNEDGYLPAKPGSPK